MSRARGILALVVLAVAVAGCGEGKPARLAASAGPVGAEGDGAYALGRHGSGPIFAAPPVNTAPPTVSGTPIEHNTLTGSQGTWVGAASFTYQWKDCNVSGAGCVNVSGATGVTYVLQPSDVGSRMRFFVTAFSSGHSTAAESAATGVVLAEEVPGEEITASCMKAVIESSKHTCGFPNQFTTGPEAGVTLTPFVGNVEPAEGETVEGKRITGQVKINHKNVTLRNDEIIPPSNNCTGHEDEEGKATECGADEKGSTPVYAAENVAGGLTVEHVKIACEKGEVRKAGARCEHCLVDSHQQAGAVSPRLLFDNFQYCAIKLYSGGEVENSYCYMNYTNGVVSKKEQHYECISDQGGGEIMKLVHNTLLNPHVQTADVFMQSCFDKLPNFTLTKNLLGGGGRLFYYEKTSVAKVPCGEFTIGTVTVTENRVAIACKGEEKQETDGGHVCPTQTESTVKDETYEQGNPQTVLDGFWPKGGYFSNYVSSVTISQSGNVNDETGAGFTFK